MIRGYCIGGGLGIAMCCDLRIATDNRTFAVPAAKLGLGYGHAGVKRLMDVVGPSFTKEIFYTARQFNAEEAKTMGLINRVVPDAELESYVKKYAETIAGNAPLTIKALKTVVGETAQGRVEARCRRHGGGRERLLRAARTTSRAATPSWRSASRCSPAPEHGWTSLAGDMSRRKELLLNRCCCRSRASSSACSRPRSCCASCPCRPACAACR